jgi:alpha-beta hydrolase superfamily lysophospholipase
VRISWLRSRQTYRLLVAALIAFSFVSVTVTENALHISRRPTPDADLAEAVARETLSVWEPARITTRDGIPLQGWLFTPHTSNGYAVILLHGVADTREGMMGHAPYLLQAGYTVLAPDFRGHGTSGGDVIGYGAMEAEDIHEWCDWLLTYRPLTRLYGLGRSMGAAILIEALPREPRFRAIVAECPFFTFEDVAYYRLGRMSHLGRAALWPVIHFGFAYARLRYGIDLTQASPADAVRTTKIPVLLVHGTADTNIPSSHSERLHAVNPSATTLWLVPGAEHLNSMNLNPPLYVRTVLDWFQEH